MFNSFTWSVDWVWSLPLIVLTVVIHVLGLTLLGEAVLRLANRLNGRSHPRFGFMLVLGGATLFVTCLHGIEVAIWASAYCILGALPDLRSSVLYSLNAMTSYGHTTLSLEYHWQMMGALEAMNGWLLFGLTTAFLFAVVQKLWLLSRTADGKEPSS